MKRIDFIQILKELGIGLLSKHIPFKPNIAKTLVLKDSVAGLQYAMPKGYLATIALGDTFTLLPDINNEYDEYAVAIMHRNQKIGYIPTLKNEAIFNLLSDQVIKFDTIVSAVDHNASSWEAITFELSIVQNNIIAPLWN